MKFCCLQVWRHITRSALRKLIVSNRTCKRVLIFSLLGVMIIHQSRGLISEGLTYDDVLMTRVHMVGLKVEIFNKTTNQMHNQSYIYCFVA
jgi:hypothetical protein